MRNIKLVLEYDGTDFCGWQSQPNGRSVQDELQRAIEQLTRQRSEVTASGRTDAGVHALGQVVHFFTASPLDVTTFVKGLNACLPPDVRVISAREMAQSFHATLDAVSKTYRYVIDNRAIARPLLRRFAWHIRAPLDAEAMHRAAQHLLGRHDFRSFETEWPNRTSSVRTIGRIEAARAGDTVNIEVEADGFLYNMVRAIAGTLAYVGDGKRPESWVLEALRAQDRRAAGPNAPPHGLFLVEVAYESRAAERRPSAAIETVIGS